MHLRWSAQVGRSIQMFEVLRGLGKQQLVRLNAIFNTKPYAITKEPTYIGMSEQTDSEITFSLRKNRCSRVVGLFLWSGRLTKNLKI